MLKIEMSEIEELQDLNRQYIKNIELNHQIEKNLRLIILFEFIIIVLLLMVIII